MKKLLFIPFFFMLCSSCFAQSISSVEGTASASSTLILNGSSFGTKSTAAPLIWDNFNNGTAGSYLKDTDSNWVAYKNNGASYDSTGYCGTLCSYNFEGPNGDGYGFNTNYREFTASEEVYMTYWFKIDYTLYSGLTYGTFKASRITSNYAGGGPGEPEYIVHYNGPGDTTIGCNMISDYEGGFGGTYNNGTEAIDGWDAFPQNFGVDFTTIHHLWVRIELYKKLSTPGLEDGITYASFIGYSSGGDNAALTRGTGFDFQLNSVLLGLMPVNAEYRGVAKCEMRIDDFYVDNTRQRVEIGDSSVFVNCTHREIQIPTAWSDTEITITFNKGSFANGTPVFLFVIDSDGNASAGYPITVGSQSGSNGTTSQGIRVRSQFNNNGSILIH